MQRIAFLIMFLICFSLPLFAQEEGEKEMGESSEAMMPPPPLADAWTKWIVGEWQGWSESPMGRSEDHMECELGLDGQFQFIEVTSKSDQGKYHGLGAVTMVGEEVRGYWIDSWRSMSEGMGKIEGNVMTMVWTDESGKYTRITERAGDDKMKVTFKMEQSDGKSWEGRAEMSRVKQTTAKGS